MKRIIINSADRHNGTISNGCVLLDDKIKGDYRLIQFTMTNCMYNINELNNQIYINEFGVGDHIIEIDEGYYYPDDLVNWLTTNTIFTTTFNQITRKFTFDIGGSTFKFTFGSNTLNSANKLLGFDEEDQNTYLTSHTSTNCIDMNPNKMLFIRILEDHKRQLQGNKYFTSSFFITGNTEFGDVLNYNQTEKNFDQICQFTDIKNIRWKIHNEKNEELTLDTDFILILEKI